MGSVSRVNTDSEGVESRVDFGLIRYANCWEDSALLVAALRPAPGMRILSIASAGDNSLHLLSHGAELVAADLNPTQIACVELRIEAIKQFEDSKALAFLGFFEDPERLSEYGLLRGALSEPSRNFWDANPSLVANGIVHAGKFERYFKTFRRRVLPLVHSRHTVAELLRAKSEPERKDFYDNTWNNLRWRLLFKIFFSRFVMGHAGRDPEFFRYVKGAVAENILARTKYALTVLDTAENPYLRYILIGDFHPAMPDWTQPSVLKGIRENASRLTLFTGRIEEAARKFGAKGFDGYNLSDIFEYLDETKSSMLYKELIRNARKGARIAYWNMLVPRECPMDLKDSVSPLAELSESLFAKDRAFFYSAFRVDEFSGSNQFKRGKKG